MKKLIYFTLSLLLLAGCNKDEGILPSDNENGNDLENNQVYTEYTAYMDDFNANSRTTINSKHNVLWQAGDEIGIYAQSNLADKWVLSGGEGTTKGNFKLAEKATGDAVTEGYKYHIAVYPYSNIACLHNEASQEDTVTISIPSIQKYVKDGIDRNSLAMIAVSENNVLNFKNVGSILKFQFKGTEKIKKIVVLNKDRHSIAGSYRAIIKDGVIASNDQTYTQDAVILDCGEGVQLSETTSTLFHIGILPVSLNKAGFTVSIEFANKMVQNIDVDASVAKDIASNIIYTMPVKEVKGTETYNRPMYNQIWMKTVNNSKPAITETMKKSNVLNVSEQMNEHGYWEVNYGKSIYFVPFEYKGRTEIMEVMLPSRASLNFKEVFAGCTNLSTINLAETNCPYIPGYCFENCTNLKSIELPETVDRIMAGAFKNSGLETFTVPASAGKYTYEASYLFENCKNLHTVTIKSKRFGGVNAFQGCDKLQNIILLDKDIDLTVYGIGFSTFKGFNTEVCNLTIHKDCTTKVQRRVDGTLKWNGLLWKTISYVDDNGKLTDGPAPEQLPAPKIKDNELWVKTIGDVKPKPQSIFALKDAVKNELGYWVLSQNETATSIHPNIFQDRTLTEVILPNTITQVLNDAFKDFTALTTITFPTGQSTIQLKVGAFRNTGFTTLTLPKSILIEYCNNGVFADCTKLEEVVYKGSVMRGDSIFSNCTALRKISFTAETLDFGYKAEKGGQFEGLNTEKIDLVINTNCSIKDSSIKPTDTTWAGKTWKSITKVTVDADGNIVP